jgi:hypothetical protein
MFPLRRWLIVVWLLVGLPISASAQVSFAHGALTWNAADAVSTVYTVSGLSFQPKVLKVYLQGLASTTDASSGTTSGRVSVGIATGTADRRCMGFIDVDGAGTADTDEHYRNDAVLATTDGAGAVTGLVDLNSITSDGFTLIVDDQGVVDLRVFWVAWGGADITNATTGEFIEPGATGNVDYVVTGSFQPTVTWVIGTQLTAAPPTSSVQSAGLSVGAATGSAAQYVVMGHSDEASAMMDTDFYARPDEILAMPAVAGGNPTARATFVQFNSDGFRLNWLARALTRRFMYLAVRGGQWAAGALLIDTTILNATATVSGLPFQPLGGAMEGSGNQQNVGVSAVNSVMGFGAWTSTTDRRSMGYVSNDGTANAEVNLQISYDAALTYPNTTGGAGIDIDLDAILSDGFRLIIDDADGQSTALQGYVVVASNPPPPTCTGSPLALLGVGCR